MTSLGVGQESLAPLREARFRLLFAGRTVSQFGSALSPIALAFAILDLTGSASDLGLVLAVYTASRLVFLLAGGVFADRSSRQRVMVATNVVQGLAQASLAMLLLSGTAELWHVVLIAAANGLGAAFFAPASQGVVPQVVSREHLQQANALLRLSLNGSQIGGAAAGGVLVATIGSGWAIAVDAATFFASALVLTRIRLPATLRIAGSNFVRELRDGWREFKARTWLWTLVVALAFINAFWTASFLVLGPLVADRELGGPAAWGLIVSCGSVGFVVGSLTALRLRPQRPLVTAVLAAALNAVPLVLLALPAPTLAIALGAALAGSGTQIFGVLWETAMQQHVPEQVLSRVIAYDWLGSAVLMPVGYALVGPAVVLFGLAPTLWAAAGVIAALCAVALASSDVRNLSGRPPASAAPEVEGASA